MITPTTHQQATAALAIYDADEAPLVDQVQVLGEALRSVMAELANPGPLVRQQVADAALTARWSNGEPVHTLSRRTSLLVADAVLRLGDHR